MVLQQYDCGYFLSLAERMNGQSWTNDDKNGNEHEKILLAQ